MLSFQTNIRITSLRVNSSFEIYAPVNGKSKTKRLSIGIYKTLQNDPDRCPGTMLVAFRYRCTITLMAMLQPTKTELVSLCWSIWSFGRGGGNRGDYLCLSHVTNRLPAF